MSRNPPRLLCHLHLCVGCSSVCGLSLRRLLSHLSPVSPVSSCVLLCLLLSILLDDYSSWREAGVHVPCLSPAIHAAARCRPRANATFLPPLPPSQFHSVTIRLASGLTFPTEYQKKKKKPDVSECHLVPFTTPHQFLTSAPHSSSLCPGPSPTSVLSCTGPACFTRSCPLHQSY